MVERLGPPFVKLSNLLRVFLLPARKNTKKGQGRQQRHTHTTKRVWGGGRPRERRRTDTDQKATAEQRLSAHTNQFQLQQALPSAAESLPTRTLGYTKGRPTLTRHPSRAYTLPSMVPSTICSTIDTSQVEAARRTRASSSLKSKQDKTGTHVKLSQQLHRPRVHEVQLRVEADGVREHQAHI